ncbi:hypothetical protein BC826DRAFT_973614 [Russula brevipes]|nr:hypothetical protein BC826DRAFT_973614 [Russula brevipes]
MFTPFLEVGRGRRRKRRGAGGDVANGSVGPPKSNWKRDGPAEGDVIYIFMEDGESLLRTKESVTTYDTSTPSTAAYEGPPQWPICLTGHERVGAAAGWRPSEVVGERNDELQSFSWCVVTVGFVAISIRDWSTLCSAGLLATGRTVVELRVVVPRSVADGGVAGVLG